MRTLLLISLVFLLHTGHHVSASNIHTSPWFMGFFERKIFLGPYAIAGIVITSFSTGVLAWLYYDTNLRSTYGPGIYDAMVGGLNRYTSFRTLRDWVSSPHKAVTTHSLPPTPLLSTENNKSIQTQVLTLKSVPGCSLFEMDGQKQAEHIEVAFESQRFNTVTSVIPWKIHIAATPSIAAKVLGVVSTVLCKKGRPLHFKFIRDEMLLNNYNNLRNEMVPELGLYKKGKFMTIYAKDTNEILDLAQELHTTLNQACQNGVLEHCPIVNHTGRPIGTTGFLWARHDQAGAPISKGEFIERAHATATAGNYRTVLYYPNIWLDLPPKAMHERVERGREECRTKDVASNEMRRYIFHDIFEEEWGHAEWDQGKEVFVVRGN